MKTKRTPAAIAIAVAIAMTAASAGCADSNFEVASASQESSITLIGELAKELLIHAGAHELVGLVWPPGSTDLSDASIRAIGDVVRTELESRWGNNDKAEAEGLFQNLEDLHNDEDLTRGYRDTANNLMKKLAAYDDLLPFGPTYMLLAGTQQALQAELIRLGTERGDTVQVGKYINARNTAVDTQLVQLDRFESTYEQYADSLFRLRPQHGQDRCGWARDSYHVDVLHCESFEAVTDTDNHTAVPGETRCLEWKWRKAETFDRYSSCDGRGVENPDQAAENYLAGRRSAFKQDNRDTFLGDNFDQNRALIAALWACADDEYEVDHVCHPLPTCADDEMLIGLECHAKQASCSGYDLQATCEAPQDDHSCVWTGSSCIVFNRAPDWGAPDGPSCPPDAWKRGIFCSVPTWPSP